MKRFNTRWVNKKNFARLGMIVASLLVLTQLGTMIIYGFVNRGYSGGNIFELVLDCISLLFYFIVLNNYRKSEDNLFFGYYASLLIIVSDFILPLIMNMVQGVFNLTLIAPSLSLIAVVVYFVFLTIENKKRQQKDCDNLKIVGIIAAVVMIASGVQNLYLLFKDLGTMVFSGANIAVLVILTMQNLAMTIGLPLIFAFYPFVLYKERYL